MAHKFPRPAQVGRQVAKWLPGPRRYWDNAAGLIVTLGKVPNLHGGYQEFFELPVGEVRPSSATGLGALVLHVGVNAGIRVARSSGGSFYREFLGWSVGAGSQSGYVYGADEQKHGFDLSISSYGDPLVLVVTIPGGCEGEGGLSVSGRHDGANFSGNAQFSLGGCPPYHRGHVADGVFVLDEVLDDYGCAKAWVRASRWKYFPARNCLARVGLGGEVQYAGGGVAGWVRDVHGHWVSPGGVLYFEWVPGVAP